MLDAGWSEKVLNDAVSVYALFNFMNRLVRGLGVNADATTSRRRARLANGGYGAQTSSASSPDGEQRDTDLMTRAKVKPTSRFTPDGRACDHAGPASQKRR